MQATHLGSTVEILARVAKSMGTRLATTFRTRDCARRDLNSCTKRQHQSDVDGGSFQAGHMPRELYLAGRNKSFASRHETTTELQRSPVVCGAVQWCLTRATPVTARPSCVMLQQLRCASGTATPCGPRPARGRR